MIAEQTVPSGLCALMECTLVYGLPRSHETVCKLMKVLSCRLFCVLLQDLLQ